MASNLQTFLYLDPLISPPLLSQCMKKYLQAQSIVSPGMYATGTATLLSPVFFYGLVHLAGLGLDGAALAFILCQLVQVGSWLRGVLLR